MFVTTEILNMARTVFLAKQIAILFQEYSLSLLRIRYLYQ